MLQRLGIEPSEGRTFGWAVAALFALGWAEVSVTNVAETLFIKRVGVEHLPLAFLANSVLLVGSTAVAARLATASDRLRLLPRVLVVLGLALLPLWALVLWGVKSAFLLLLFAAKQLPSIAFVVFWIAMGDLLNAQQAKRLFAPLTAGLTLGGPSGFPSFFTKEGLDLDPLAEAPLLEIDVHLLDGLLVERVIDP